MEKLCRFVLFKYSCFMFCNIIINIHQLFLIFVFVHPFLPLVGVIMCKMTHWRKGIEVETQKWLSTPIQLSFDTFLFGPVCVIFLMLSITRSDHFNNCGECELVICSSGHQNTVSTSFCFRFFVPVSRCFRLTIPCLMSKALFHSTQRKSYCNGETGLPLLVFTWWQMLWW